MLSVGGVQQNPHRFQGLRAQHHCPRMDLLRLTRDAVDVKNASGAVAVGLHQDLVDHGVRNMGAIARLQSVGHRGEGGIEVRMRDAAAFARTAIMAGRAAIDGLGEVGAARRHRHPAQLCLDPIPELGLHAIERHGRQKVAVGQMRQALSLSANAHVFFHQVVIGLDVLVAEGPVVAVAVEGGSLEVEIAQAQADASPDVGAPAGDAQPSLPTKRLVLAGGVGLVEVVGRTSRSCIPCRRSSPSARDASCESPIPPGRGTST